MNLSVYKYRFSFYSAYNEYFDSTNSCFSIRFFFEKIEIQFFKKIGFWRKKRPKFPWLWLFSKITFSFFILRDNILLVQFLVITEEIKIFYVLGKHLQKRFHFLSKFFGLHSSSRAGCWGWGWKIGIPICSLDSN